MANSINDQTTKNCTGCGVCGTICPVNALSFLTQDDKGFFSPKIDHNICVSCGKCKTVCYKFISQDSMGISFKKTDYYAAKSSSEQIIKSCSSGGIAHEIATYGLQNGYIVVGTVYDYDNNIAKGIIVKNKNDLEKLKGSKYLQSNMSAVVKQISDIARENILAKFIILGTPCQILGVKKMFEVLHFANELLLVDLFCHGVPSYLIWTKYLKENNITNLNSVQFRDTNFPWHEFVLAIRSKGTTKISHSWDDDFYAFFFDNVCLNEACNTCLVRKYYSSADLRLGDFWGKRYNKTKDGVSLVGVSTKAGEQLLKRLEQENRLLRLCKATAKEAWEAQAKENYTNCKQTQIAYESLKEGNSLSQTIKEYRKIFPVPKKMILTFKKIISHLPVNLRFLLRQFKI